jgi:hypothetical protein
MIKYWLILTNIVFTLMACEKDRLKNDLYSPLDENSGKQVFIIDSIRISSFGTPNKYMYCYFRIDNAQIKNPSLLKKILSYKSGKFQGKWDIKAKYFTDLTPVQSGHTYTYNLALLDFYNDTSKLSEPIVVTIP